jgi:hypothetical protein
MTNTSFIDDLSDIQGLNSFAPSATSAAQTFTKPARQTYPCESCGGTGIYRGVRLHQPETKCFACGGRGFFYTSTKDRYASRQKAAQSKASKKTMAQAVFNEANPGMIARLTKEAEWNDFARKMLDGFNQWDSLTERQVAAVLNMFAKIDEKRAAKAVAKEANSGEVDISKIEAMFATAKASGLKKLAFTADGLKIKPAKETSRNAGALYVTLGSYDSYQGKIVAGRFYPVSGVLPDTLAKLNEIAVNPSQAARDYGKKTGVCCCCGRELTDPASIAAGIGPICEANWGL